MFARIVAILLLLCSLAVMTGWAVLAIYFGDSSTSLLQVVLAAASGFAGLVTCVAIFIRRWRFRALSAFAVLFAVVLAWFFNIAPSNDRNWQPEVAKLPRAVVDGDLVTVSNIRNFKYRTETDFTASYDTRTYDVSKLRSVDLFAVYWMGPAIAHTIVSFGFDGGDYLAVSIETRKEKGEGYSTIRGFFRQYELFYVVADERDVIRLRTDFRNDPPEQVYRFRLLGSLENGRRFFLDYMQAINDLNDHPRFYNTLTTNCTSAIWLHSHVNPGHVPFSWKILASGYAPEYLYEMGRLDTSLPFSTLMQRGHVNPLARSLDDGADFSAAIRADASGSSQGD